MHCNIDGLMRLTNISCVLFSPSALPSSPREGSSAALSSMSPPTTRLPKMAPGIDALTNKLMLNWTGDPAAAGCEVVWRASEDPFWTEVRVPVARVPAITKTRINSA
ncbi:hypothetical protein B0H17DRAFT_1124896 [Mycena rosella]|uniref:Uncharacterized protein n=1 Tax=Mycena rosella TaxID=1033263 RepID=A0AAD7GYS4_MYCRO|nr:hypothetical protein B0H17DRAFT_1124896 [Mycena rosella]